MVKNEFLGIDIGGTAVKIGLVRETGEVLDVKTYAVDFDGYETPILDTVTRKCVVERLDKFTFRIILTQGLNRQIRRMCEYLGYEVKALKRIRIINISLDIPLGRYRELTPNEIAQLNQLIAPSSKTEEASLPKPVLKKTHPKLTEKVAIKSVPRKKQN